MSVLGHILYSWRGRLHSFRSSGQNLPQHTHLNFKSELTYTVPQGDMKSIYTELALYGSKKKCARTDTVFFPYLRSAMVRFPLLKTLGVWVNRLISPTECTDTLPRPISSVPTGATSPPLHPSPGAASATSRYTLGQSRGRLHWLQSQNQSYPSVK